MPDKRPKMIVGLRWEETSGVDHPANEEEGWAVMKSVDAGDGSDAHDEVVTDEDLDQIIDEERAAIEKEQSALTEIGGLVKDAPDEVADAFKVVTEWLKAARASSEDEYGQASKGLLRQVFRMVQRAVKGPAPKTYSEKRVATVLRSKLSDLAKELAAILNDKDADKKAKKARVKELLAALRESVKAELENDGNGTD